MFLHFLEQYEHKIAFLELAHLAANADGNVNWKEKGHLRSYIEEMGMNQSDIHISERRSPLDVVGGIQDKGVQTIFLIETLMLLYIDGDYNDEEKQIVIDMKELFGFSDAAYESIKNWVIRMDELKIEGMKLILSS